MTVAPAPRQGLLFPARPSYLGAGTTLGSWLFTTDHKRIAILYAITITIFFFLGGVAVSIVRLELFTPEADVVGADTYNRLFTFHGIVMVWFFMVPAIPATLGNFLLPLMIGARDVAFPRLNLFSWYLALVGAAATVATLVAGGVDTGWTFYTPFSTMFSNSNVLAAAFGVFAVGFSSIATGINFIATIHMLRAPGLTWFRLPLFVWSLYATSLVMVLATPVLAVTLLLLMAERWLHLPIFDPSKGGDPLLFQHLFWFYSHPAVYIMVLPAMGVISEVITCFARRRVFGYTFMVYALVSIAGIGFFVWGHHMFVAGISPFAGLVFSFLSFVVAVPSAIKVFNWTATLYRGQVGFEAPMLYALGFLGLFTVGGLTGLFLASIPVDVHVTDTYFVVAHFHYIMVGGTVSAYFAGLHYWWPKITGRLYPETWARFAAILMFFGFNLTFFPQFILGYLGMPRRYHVYPPEFQVWNVMSSSGAAVLAAAYVLPLGYFAWSLVQGARAPRNPWDATGLEWRTSSPPPPHNFDVAPRIDVGPYDYHAPGIAPPAPADAEPGPGRHGMSGQADRQLREPWPDLRLQREAAAFGIWVFLAGELLFFGALILTYTVCRIMHPAGFLAAARQTNLAYGTANTAILLTSSLTMALASQTAEREGNRRTIAALLAATAFLGGVFLVTKGFEYAEDIRKGLVPGAGFALSQAGAQLFFSLYWVMTGVHAVHLAIGIGLVGRLCVLGWRASLRLGGSPQVEVTALYWHLVDVIWVILYPLIYLPGRSG